MSRSLRVVRVDVLVLKLPQLPVFVFDTDGWISAARERQSVATWDISLDSSTLRGTCKASGHETATMT